jgi:hypothetical protein
VLLDVTLRKTARLLAISLIASVMLLPGCLGQQVRTVYVPQGTPVRLREPVKAKVWVFDKDGTLIPSEMTIPEGWWALPDPQKK